jgi:hypothetical protein
MAATHAVGAAAASQQERLAVAQIPHNIQESLRTSANSRALNPVRLGQLAQLPASGISVSSLLLNGAAANSSRIFDSIQDASNAE